MAFEFRLKALLRHREFLLREAQGAFGAALAEKMKIESDIEGLRNTLEGDSKTFEEEQREGIGVKRYLYFKDRLAFLEQELRQAFKRMQNAAAEVERRKRAMIECDKSVKTLENIQTRDRQSYKLAREREEQKRVDYAAVLLAHRKTIDKGEKP